MRFTFLRSLLLASVALCVPAAADAVTVRDIIELTKAGLPDEVLIALIDADRTIFMLDAQQILTLKKAGVRDAVLLKMIRSRREFDTAIEEAPPAPEPPPIVVIGGERAGTQLPPYSRVPTPFFTDAVVVPQYFSVPMFWGPVTSPHVQAPVHQAPPQPFLPGHRGFGRFINDGWIGRP